MRLLLDTQAFLWWISGDERLSAEAAAAIAAGENDVWFSAVSAWEITIKAGLGRLHFDRPLEVFLIDELEANAVAVLPLHIRHALALADLPDIHRDPFDRMLIAQAIVEDLAIVTADEAIKRYPVEVVW